MFYYVINLDRRQDRYNKFLKTVEKLSNKDDKFIRFSAFDGYNHINEIKRFNIENDPFIKILKNLKVPLQKGVFGCLMSHILVLYEILKNDEIKEDEYVGILEDDIYLCDNFENNYDSFKNMCISNYGDIDLIYTGGRFSSSFSITDNSYNEFFEKTSLPNLFFRKNKKISDFNSLKSHNFIWERTTLSFIVKKSSCKCLINLLYNSSIKRRGMNGYYIIPIDHVYAYSHNKINMYDFFPHLFYSPLASKDSNVQNSSVTDNIIL